MKKTKLFILLMMFACLPGFAQQSKPLNEQFEMKTYYLVFLKKGPIRTQDSTTVAKIQEQHMAHLTKMFEDKKMCIAGPLMDNTDLRGICVYNTETLEEAKTLAESDPAVKSGRLMIEIHPWYAAKGTSLP